MYTITWLDSPKLFTPSSIVKGKLKTCPSMILGQTTKRPTTQVHCPVPHLVEELGDIVDLVVEDEPHALVLPLARLVLLHLLQSDHLRHAEAERVTYGSNEGYWSRSG